MMKPLGNLFQCFNPQAWQFHEEIARKYGSFCKLHGLMGGVPLFHTYDPKAIYHLLIKDQNSFDETKSFILLVNDFFQRTIDRDTESLSSMNTLIFGKGMQHRKQRKMLNPVFSIAHLRDQATIETYLVISKLRDTILRQVSDGPRDIDMLQWMTRTALELIGQSGLGYSFDPLTEDGQEHPFSTSVKDLMKAIGKFMFSRFYVLPWAHKIGSPGFQRFIIDLLPWKDLHNMRDIVDTMHNTSTEIIQAKKRALLAGDDALESEVGRVKANMTAAEEDRLTEGELLGQMSTITFAAMDTTSNALSRILDLLSKNPDIQTRLREEIREARQLHGDLQYDELVALPLLDAVCRETLRLHPPVPFLTREAKKDGVIPLSTPITTTDGKELNEVLVSRGVVTLISIWACNRNPEIWGPDATEWKPDRWLKPLPESVVDAHIPGVYSHLMTFIGGSRSCIGFKFSQLEMKVILSLLLESFQFAPTDQKVYWQLNGVVQPSLDKDGAKLQLPLKVSLAPPAPPK
ncbi:hypothetical protein EST38_g11278 [Candolleomyces aberdarensis]|uniref:Cytochrome P450 n=1 Tax=Candolleomyces aberdarensis TaxID=2316362 RepID=A0A4V1Q2C2_9AGAR|nr:hypothetical protein EST38_g11278 [Candolleomyces aberdarensis]